MYEFQTKYLCYGGRCGLVGSGSSPRLDIKTKYKYYFFDDFLSADFWQKL